MAHSTLEVASCLGSGNMSCRDRESGESGVPDEPVQNHDPAIPPRLVPQNFVWRLVGKSSGDLIVGDMAVDVPVLRECFDPWTHDRHRETGEGCRGCSKISKARAAATKPPPHVPTDGECQFTEFVHLDPPTAPTHACWRPVPPRWYSTWMGSTSRFIRSEYHPSPAQDTQHDGSGCVPRGVHC